MPVLKLKHGDCLEVLKKAPDNYADSLVTDPPAGISFMGKSWDDDKGGRDAWVAWMTDVMRECLRVLKPGAHGLVWALPRTAHWTATALEDAGFEVRDCVTHLFGTGFPKSLDISKAIDKAAGAEREVVGKRTSPYTPTGREESPDYGSFKQPVNAQGYLEYDITAPATDAAKQWQGWGTALKPACEFWWLVRKPLSEKTVAANVLRWGTGGLNIDASRINACNSNVSSAGVRSSAKQATAPTTAANGATGAVASGASTTPSDGQTRSATCVSSTGTTSGANTATCSSTDSCGNAPTDQCQTDSLCITSTKRKTTTGSRTSPSCPAATTLDTTPPATPTTPNAKLNTPVAPESVGRFPSNLVLDEEAAAALDEQSGTTQSSDRPRNNGAFKSVAKGAETARVSHGHADSGGASRFFYVAKASKKDRGEGNTHPTVKSTALMEYLLRLVTPPNGVVLDPFMGSGSTGVAALAAGFGFTGIEKDEAYFAICKSRLESDDGSPDGT